MIDVLLNASATGGVMILLWCITYPLSKKYFRSSWHYAILKTAMVFLIFPIGMFASVFAPILNNALSGLSASLDLPDIYGQIQTINIDAETVNTVNSALSDFVFPDADHPPSKIRTDDAAETIDSEIGSIGKGNTIPNIPYLQLIWLCTALILFSLEMKKMRRFTRRIFNISNSSVESDTLNLFTQCKKELDMRSNIILRTSEYIKTPLAFGLFKPCIILPETDMSADEKRLALTHELTHIKNGDLWLKFAASIIAAVHWFNPFAHILRHKIAMISEEYCDECVVKAMTREEKFMYGRLILKVVSDIAVPQVKFCSTLSASTKNINNIKRRLSNMMNTKKSRKGMIALSIIAALILCSFATVYAFAANVDANQTIITEKDGETAGADEDKDLAQEETDLTGKLRRILGEREILERVKEYYSTYDREFISWGELVEIIDTKAIEEYREYLKEVYRKAVEEAKQNMSTGEEVMKIMEEYQKALEKARESINADEAAKIIEEYRRAIEEAKQNVNADEEVMKVIEEYQKALEKVRESMNADGVAKIIEEYRQAIEDAKQNINVDEVAKIIEEYRQAIEDAKQNMNEDGEVTKTIEKYRKAIKEAIENADPDSVTSDGSEESYEP